MRKKYDYPLKDNPKKNSQLRGKLPSEMFDIIEAEAGDVLFLKLLYYIKDFQKKKECIFKQDTKT